MPRTTRRAAGSVGTCPCRKPLLSRNVVHRPGWASSRESARSVTRSGENAASCANASWLAREVPLASSRLSW